VLHQQNYAELVHSHGYPLGNLGNKRSRPSRQTPTNIATITKKAAGQKIDYDDLDITLTATKLMHIKGSGMIYLN
jgi:hypothetical protein